jgi:hypothetical protein
VNSWFFLRGGSEQMEPDRINLAVNVQRSKPAKIALLN